ncbi:uncharacterized protein ACA1_351790 [Acanthamoeba castellanii str. Neff]|uniref:F-box domain-containing protein n=1 Tax=Acanthamoeba castellanii (strain ATCC 30010 / Neff) TaxID=1257118 RepID=L8GG27_ACACF|nr:uncharacterized protein ACA1_351790 [Acanthamoeba castellanii str. Neff]ELR11111.1 hypothetical protein ACA1_351790 [Acanthamoeba castellanii str. Neff]
MEAWEVLPLEVWALVLRQPPLVPADLARAACVCRALHELIGPFIVSPSPKSGVWASASARQWRLVAAQEAHPILTLAVGSCGVQVAVEYWRRVVAEHDLSGSSAGDEVVNVRLSDHSLYGLGTHFRHTEQGKPRPQAWTITLY